MELSSRNCKKGVIYTKRSVLKLYRNHNDEFHSTFKNNHGRLIYLRIAIRDNECNINECYYLDRSSYSVPKKAFTKKCATSELLNVIRNELDKDFIDIDFNYDTLLSKKQLINSTLGRRKYNILIILKEGNVLKTVFKNKFRRSIYLEISIGVDKSLISKCRYCDKRGEKADITPYGLKTIYFESGIDNILSVVNTELEGGFTDILITAESTIKLDRPICGSI